LHWLFCSAGGSHRWQTVGGLHRRQPEGCIDSTRQCRCATLKSRRGTPSPNRGNRGSAHKDKSCSISPQSVSAGGGFKPRPCSSNRSPPHRSQAPLCPRPAHFATVFYNGKPHAAEAEAPVDHSTVRNYFRNFRKRPHVEQSKAPSQAGGCCRALEFGLDFTGR
jgi:hypothetical protein